MAKLPIDAEASKQWILSQVGYGKPPQHSQFKKGQSGNPLGRPRKNKTKPSRGPIHSGPLELVQEHLTRKITAKDGSGTHQVPAHLASVRMIEQGAAEGSVQLRKYFYTITRQAELEQQARMAEDRAFWIDYIQRHAEISRLLRKADPLLAEWLPAPEDLTMQPGLLAQYRGAITTGEAQNLEHLRRLRDALIAQVALDIRSAPLSRLGGQNSPDLSVIPPLIAALNLLFPARIVRQGEYYWDEVSRLADDPSSLLDREVTRLWGALGYPPISALGKIPSRPSGPRLNGSGRRQ